MIDAGLIAARFAHYAVLILAFGAFDHARRGGGPRLAPIVVGTSLMVPLAAAAVLATTAAGLGPLSDASVWTAVIEETGFGQIWSVRLILALMLAGLSLVWLRTGARKTATLGLMLTAALLASIAWTGHAQIETGWRGTVHRVADALHLLAAAVWLGALLPFLFLLRAARPLAGRRLVAFHNVGLAAVLVLIGSGLVNGWFLVGSAERLISTPYGRLLLLKLLLFAMMIGLAARNRLTLVRAFCRALPSGGEDAAPRLQRHILVEFILGLGVLLIVAVLGTIKPAAG